MRSNVLASMLSLKMLKKQFSLCTWHLCQAVEAFFFLVEGVI